MNRQIHLLILLALLCHVLSAQQNPQPHFKNYSTQHGLPSPETYCAFQDSRGYMWFGTDNGASRFDGYEFRTYNARDGLTSNVIFDIHEDAKGRIWFGTMTGEAFILEGDTIVPYRFNHLVEQYREQFDVGSLAYLEKDETAYFDLILLGILRIDSLGRDSLFSTKRSLSRLIIEVAGIPKVFKTNIVKGQKEWAEWAQYEKRYELAHFKFLSEDKSFEIELPFYNEKTYSSSFNAQKLSTGHLLVFNRKYLYCLEGEKLLWVIPFDLGHYLRVNEILEDETGAIWLCLGAGYGLRRYSNIEALKKNEYDLFLNGLSISNFCKDFNGGMWIVTQEKGVFYCPTIQLLTFNSNFGFSDDFVSAVTFRNEYELFAGCQNGDIFQIDLRQSTITKKLTNYSNWHNHDLLYQKEKDLLWSNGAYWKNEEWSFVNIRHSTTKVITEFKTGRAENLHFNTAGELLACNSVGFSVIDIENDSVKYASSNTNLRERTFALHTDQKQRLWVGNARGLFEFRDSILVSPGVEHPAFHMRVEDIDEFPGGDLVFGTKGLGVIRWKGEEVLELSRDDGLTSNMIEDVHVDENGILWVGTLNGLNKITFDKGGNPIIRPFTVANGLPSNEIYRIKSYAGQVWLCTAGGLIQFHEPKEETDAAAPIIQYLKVNGNEAPLATGQEFKYRQNNLEFRFLAINYRQNGRIPYRYRLSEAADWQYTQNLNVNYPQLPPNDYRFEVQAQNQDGYWSSSTAYAFAILPPWWNTWWARSLAFGLLLAGLFYYQRQYAAKLRKEAAIQQQITNLERSALQAQMNPHFIFNCLNSIQNFILQNDRKQAVEYLSRFAQLVRHNLNASVQGRVTLEEEVQILENYLALERERFNRQIDYRITVDEALNKEQIVFPPLLIQPYVENAVVHGLSKKAEGGLIEINFGRDNGLLLVTVRDNGAGYRLDEDLESRPRHKSVGMTITQKRLELLGEAAAHPVAIEVLKDADGAALGTEVRLRLALAINNEGMKE